LVFLGDKVKKVRVYRGGISLNRNIFFVAFRNIRLSVSCNQIHKEYGARQDIDDFPSMQGTYLTITLSDALTLLITQGIGIEEIVRLGEVMREINQWIPIETLKSRYHEEEKQASSRGA